MAEAAGRRRCRLLLTRAADDAAALARTLAGHAIETLSEPLLSIEFADGPPLDLTGVQALVATSGNGVRAFARRDRRRQLPLYAVGDATARTARDAGFAAVDSASGDVAALAALLRARLDPAAGALLHIAASAVAGDLAGDLRRAGFAYRREILYRARTADRLSRTTMAALQEDALDGVLLFSPRTAATFGRLLGDAGLAAAAADLDAFCLSPQVATAISGLRWRRQMIAAAPTEAALIAAVLARS